MKSTGGIAFFVFLVANFRYNSSNALRVRSEFSRHPASPRTSPDTVAVIAATAESMVALDLDFPGACPAL